MILLATEVYTIELSIKNEWISRRGERLAGYRFGVVQLFYLSKIVPSSLSPLENKLVTFSNEHLMHWRHVSWAGCKMLGKEGLLRRKNSFGN